MIFATVAAISACSKPVNALTWTAIDLPGATVQDVAACGGQWWAVGSFEKSPAAWVGDSSLHFRQVRFVPAAGSYYGPLQEIDSVACAGGRVAMIGEVPGGVHGNLRVSTWLLRPGGTVAENVAPFGNYGGEEAVGIGPIAAGPGGFAIAATRTTGAAVVLSSDGVKFDLHDRLAGGGTDAQDAVELPDGNWLIVGGARAAGKDEHAEAWIGAAAETIPDAPVYSELQRVVRDGDDVVAAGAVGTRFATWRWHDGVWSAGPRFGGDPQGVRSLTLVGEGTPAGERTVVAGGGLWIGGKRQNAPASPVGVAGDGDTLLLAGGGHLWRTTTR